MYCQIKQNDSTIIILIDKKDVLIKTFSNKILAGYYFLYK